MHIDVCCGFESVCQSVRLSVRQSVISGHSIKTVKHITETAPTTAQGLKSRILVNFQCDHSNGSAKYKIWRLWKKINNSPYVHSFINFICIRPHGSIETLKKHKTPTHKNPAHSQTPRPWSKLIHIPDQSHNRVTMHLPASFKQRSMIV